MSQFDLKIFVAHCDLYFMAEWFCISWKLFSGWTSYFGIMSQYDLTWPPNICRSLWPIFHGPLNLPFILKTVWCMNIILSDYELVWHNIWPRNKCRSLWPLFHGPVILPYILNSIWWRMSHFWKMSSVIDLWPQNKFMSQWPIFHGPVISIFCSVNHFSFIGKAQCRRATLSCDSSYYTCR